MTAMTDDRGGDQGAGVVISDAVADTVLEGCKHAGVFISPYKAKQGEALDYDEWVQFRREAIKGIVSVALAASELAAAESRHAAAPEDHDDR